jgi:hypothetical protein
MLFINRCSMEQFKREILPGTLNMMFLNPSAHSGHMGTALPGGLSKSAATSSNSARDRFILRCFTSSRWVGLDPDGAYRETTGAPGFTRLNGP